jgi:hypothetical protein
VPPSFPPFSDRVVPSASKMWLSMVKSVLHEPFIIGIDFAELPGLRIDAAGLSLSGSANMFRAAACRERSEATNKKFSYVDYWRHAAVAPLQRSSCPHLLILHLCPEGRLPLPLALSHDLVRRLRHERRRPMHRTKRSRRSSFLQSIISSNCSREIGLEPH